MKLNRKFIAIPAIAIAAGLGLSLTACGGSSHAPASSQSVACQDWSQAHTAANNDDSALFLTDVHRVIADTSDPTILGYLQSMVTDTNNGDITAEVNDAGNLDSYCNGSSAAAATQAPAPTQAPVTQQQAPVATQAPAAPTQAPAAQSDAWSVAVAYTNDVNAGDNWAAWNLLSPSLQSSGWGNYSVFVADFTPLSFDNVTYVSSSGDSVTFTFTLHNHSTGSTKFTTCTYTVDGGIITSST